MDIVVTTDIAACIGTTPIIAGQTATIATVLTIPTIRRAAVDLDLVRCIQVAASVHRLPASVISGDEGVVIGSALAAAFGSHQALRPWTVARRASTRVTIVGALTIDNQQTALDQASPQAQACVLGVRELPTFSPFANQKLRFEARVCPTVNRTSKSEIDVYLAAVDRADRECPDHRPLDREFVYKNWFSERLLGARIEAVRMTGFTITSAFRPTHNGNGKKWIERKYPDTTLRGVATIEDPIVFAETMRAGVGRQRGYGYGLIWVEPVS
jgi:CRISPR system Cascade subunit CasE